jgi:DNA-binding transcriptional ArsR family regulator
MKDIVKIFKALADPTRLRITLLLVRRELCVCELMYVLDMEQSRVSHHMRVLREAGLAEDVREGRLGPALEAVLALPFPDPPRTDGAAVAAQRLLELM